MKNFTDAIRKAVVTQNWFGGLFIALCMPDICGAIETPSEKNSVRYKRWFNTNFSKYVALFSADDAWYFRCSCLHEGIDSNVRSVYKKVHFITPPPRNSIVHDNIFGGVIQLQIDVFCHDMANAVDDWYSHTASKNRGMDARVQELINIHGPESLIPHVSFGKS